MVQAATTDEPLTRGHKKKARTRRDLIAAAVRVIARQGEAFSIAEIAEAAGVSHGTFYNYFNDREALIDAVVPVVMVGFAADSAVAVEDDDPARRFAIITALVLRRAAVAPDEVRVLLRLDAVHRAVVESPALDQLRADIAAGVATGRFAVDADAAALDVIVGAMLFASRRIVEGAVADDYHVQVVARLLRSLGVTDADPDALAEHAASAARRHADNSPGLFAVRPYASR